MLQTVKLEKISYKGTIFLQTRKTHKRSLQVKKQDEKIKEDTIGRVRSMYGSDERHNIFFRKHKKKKKTIWGREIAGNLILRATLRNRI
jgi:hypothetical protein